MPAKSNNFDQETSMHEAEEINETKWKPPEFPRFLRIILAIIANTITFLNFASGVAAIVLVSINARNFYLGIELDNFKFVLWAGRLVLLAIIFDFTDGIPARLAQKKPGFFGTFVDSAADTVSFGLAPAVMIALSLPLRNTISPAHQILGVFSVLVGVYYGFCTLFRLVRFTKTPSKKWFKGIPSPGAGCAAACYIIIKLYIESQIGSDTIATPIIGLILMILTGTMMIVQIKYPTTKLPKNFLEIFLLGLAAVTIVACVATPFAYVIYPAAFMFALTIFYVSYGPFYMVKHMMERAKTVDDY